MKKKYCSLAIAGLTCFSLLLPLTADTLLPQVCAAEEETEGEKQEEKKTERFQLILTDNIYSYYMDMETARWIDCPYNGDQIIDVWIKLIPDAAKMTAVGEYSYPQKYFLEHYYIHPKKQQIQFMAELEVTGRPMNDIDMGKYDSTAWENLVPESIEDKIFHAVVKNIKKAKHAKKKSSSGNDFLFNVLHIGL